MIDNRRLTRSADFRDPREDGRVCELCGGREFSLLHAWNPDDPWNMATILIAVWQCRCGFTFLHPVPTSNQLPDSGDWWSPLRRQPSRRPGFKNRWRKIRHAMIGTSKQRLIWATRKAVPNGRLLDVGCGNGETLKIASEFYDCFGLEPSSQAAASARARGFPIIESTLEEAEMVAGSFDVVLLDSVIEHVNSPHAFLKKVNRILRIGGVVALLTPKLNGPAHFFHGAAWNGFRHGYHTFLFTGKTLGQCLRDTGFEVLRRPRRDRWLDDILILWGRKLHDA
jgi:SAM-dependent methyltransferase